MKTLIKGLYIIVTITVLLSIFPACSKPVQKDVEQAREFNKDEKEKSLLYYTKALENENTEESMIPVIYFEKGKVNYQLKEYQDALGDLNKAIDDFDMILKLNPEYVNAYNNRGLCLFELEEYQGALDNYMKALQIDPGYVLAYYNSGQVFSAVKEYEEAVKYYSEAPGINPSYIDAYISRGHVYQQLKIYTKAVTDYSKIIELSPGSPMAYNDRGWTYLWMEEWDFALEDFSVIEVYGKGYPDIYINIACYYWAAEKEKDKALEYLELAFQNGYPDVKGSKDKLYSIERDISSKG